MTSIRKKILGRLFGPCMCCTIWNPGGRNKDKRKMRRIIRKKERALVRGWVQSGN